MSDLEKRQRAFDQRQQEAFQEFEQLREELGISRQDMWRLISEACPMRRGWTKVKI